jgi:hypothetical protein
MSRKSLRAALLVPVLTLTAAGPAVAMSESEAYEGTDCMVETYALYNACLVSADTVFGRLLCDVAFEINALVCQRV